MPAFSNQKVANHIIHLHTMLRFLSVSRHLIYQYRYIPQEGNICPINQNYGPPGPSLLWYRHFFPTSVIPSQFPRSLRNNFQKRAKVSQAEPQYVWRTLTHSREGGGGSDEERDKSKLHLCGWVLVTFFQDGNVP